MIRLRGMQTVQGEQFKNLANINTSQHKIFTYQEQNENNCNLMLNVTFPAPYEELNYC